MALCPPDIRYTLFALGPVQRSSLGVDYSVPRVRIHRLALWVELGISFCCVRGNLNECSFFFPFLGEGGVRRPLGKVDSMTRVYKALPRSESLRPKVDSDHTKQPGANIAAIGCIVCLPGKAKVSKKQQYDPQASNPHGNMGQFYRSFMKQKKASNDPSVSAQVRNI